MKQVFTTLLLMAALFAIPSVMKADDLITSTVNVSVDKAGTLSELLPNDKDAYTNLCIYGELNGTDFNYLKSMANLSVLDLYHARIVAGGDCYRQYNSYTWYTEDDKVGFFLLAEYPALTSIKLPKGIKELDEDALFGNYSLTTVELPEGLQKIGTSAFSSDYNLENINIPSTVTWIGSSVFFGCYKLKSIELPPSVTRIVAYAFSECAGLTSFEFPAGLTTIESGVLLRCPNITSVIIPSSVTTLEKDALYGMNALKTIEIPSSVTRMLYGCLADDLDTIYVNWEEPIAITPSAFSDYSYSNAILYVPKGTKSAYENAEFWKQFAHIEEYEPTPSNIQSAEVKPSSANGEIFDLQGRMLNKAHRGLNVINGKKVIVR